MKKSQMMMILNDLLDGKEITPIDALNNYGCFRLGARIYNLRELGYDIKTKTPESGKKYAIYYMTQEAIDKIRNSEVSA